MDSDMPSSREQKLSSLLQQEINPERYSLRNQTHILDRTYDQPRAIHRTDCTGSSPLGTVPDLRYNRVDLSSNPRPQLSQFRLSDHMPISSLTRSLTGLSDMKNNFYNITGSEKNGSSPHSLNRGLSLKGSAKLDTKFESSAHQQSRAQSLLDLHRQFSPLETRTAMGSQLSLKSFNNQSPALNSLQPLNYSYNNAMVSSSENHTDKSPPYNVFSYQSRKSNVPACTDSPDRSRTVIVKSTLCYNTSTQTEIPFNESMADPSVGTPRMRFEDLQTSEVSSPGLSKKIELYGRICEEKSVQTSLFSHPLDLKIDNHLLSNNKNQGEVFLHRQDIVEYGPFVHDIDRKQTDVYLSNSDKNQSRNYIRQSSYEYNSNLKCSQKNQIIYASQDILNGDILRHRQSTDNSLFNTTPAFQNKTDEDYHNKSGVISGIHSATVLSHDPSTIGCLPSVESTGCVKGDTDSNNNISSHHKPPSDLYHFSDWGSTVGSYNSRHTPSVFDSATHLGSSFGSHGYSSNNPEEFFDKSRSSSLARYDHLEAGSDSTLYLSTLTTDPGSRAHNLSLTSGVGSEVSSMYSYPRSPPLDSSHDTTFMQNHQSLSHVASDTNLSSTFHWKKIVILNPDHIKTSRRGSDSVFIDEDDLEPKFLLYKDFRQKTFPVEVPLSPKKLSENAFLSGDLNQVRPNTNDYFKPGDRTVSDEFVPPSLKACMQRISESLRLGQIQEEAEALNARTDNNPRLISKYENISFTDGRSNRSGVEKYGTKLWQNEPWRRGSFDISSDDQKSRRSERLVETTGSIRRNSLDSAKLKRHSYQGGTGSSDFSAFRNYERREHSTLPYSVASSQDLMIVRRDSDSLITKQMLQNLQTANRHHSLRSFTNDLKDSEYDRNYKPVKYYEEDSNSSSSTLQDISSLDNSLASVRNLPPAETVAELIVKVNENLTKSAERMGRIRRSGSISSRSSVDFTDTNRSERVNRRETEWTRIRSLSSLRSSPERDHWLNWSSFTSDDLNDDTGILTSSTPRSSFALSRENENMLEACSHNASMDSGLVVSPIYQNFPTKRRPPPPPKSAAGSDAEPPPLPPRMNRQKPPSSSGTSAVPDPEGNQYRISTKEKHRIEVIPLGKPQDEDVRVDTSKMNFKDLINQWKNNSPRDDSSPSDLRRREPKIVERHQYTGKPMSSVPTTFDPTKTTTSLTSTYGYDPGHNFDTKSLVFSSASSSSTLHSSTSKSAFSTSPPSPFGAVSGALPIHHHPFGPHTPALNNKSSSAYPGLQNTSSSSINAVTINSGGYTDGILNTPTSSEIRVTLVNQNPGINTGHTSPFGKISFLPISRSRSSSDLLSEQQAGSNAHSVSSGSAPVKFHRKLCDRSSSHQDILSDKLSQSSSQHRYHFPQNGGDYSKSQSAEDPKAVTVRSPSGERIKSTPVANGRLSNSTLTLSNGYEITDSNHGFATESYTGHKNKSNRNIGTYKRSVSAVGVQSTCSTQGNPSGDSHSTPFRDFSLGQQPWNSESILSNQDTGTNTLPQMGSQIGKCHKDEIQASQGCISGVSGVTPVRPPRPNARGRQNAKQISAATAAASSTTTSNVSQKTKQDSLSLSALDNGAASASFSEQANGDHRASMHRPAPSTSSSPQYDPSYQVQGSVSSGTPTMSGQGHCSGFSRTPNISGQDDWSDCSGTPTPSDQPLDRNSVHSLHRLHYSPQHKQLALNNSLNSSLSRASLDNAHPQSTFIQNSSAKLLSPCSPSEKSPANSPSKDHCRNVLGATGFITSPSLEGSPKSPLETPAIFSNYLSHHRMNSPQEDTHKSSRTPSLTHLRQPSQEEIECEEKAMELAEELDDNDQKLLEVLRQDRAKKRMLYMDGLFSDLVADEEKSTFKPKSRSSMKNRTLDRVVGASCDSSGGFKSHSLPRDYQQTTASKSALSAELLVGASDSSCETSSPGLQDNWTVVKHKEELVEKLQKKIQVLKDEKLSLQQEIADNILLGQQVCQVADSRCQTQSEKDKFMTFIDDLEKIVRLLLNLSGQLARAENAVQALGPEADTKLKKLTWDKRERLHAKYEEAKMLKEAVDRRSEQLFCMLQERLGTQELSDYKHFINMKSRLTIQMQEVDDHLALAEQQVVALKRSLPSGASLPASSRET